MYPPATREWNKMRVRVMYWLNFTCHTVILAQVLIFCVFCIIPPGFGLLLLRTEPARVVCECKADA